MTLLTLFVQAALLFYLGLFVFALYCLFTTRDLRREPSRPLYLVKDKR